MKTPALLAGASLIFWGWQTGILLLPLALALILESARWHDWRLDFSATDFNRVWDLCFLLFLGAGVYCLFSKDANSTVAAALQATEVLGLGRGGGQAAHTVFTFFQLMPLVFFPMAAAQAYSESGSVPASAFSWRLRRKKGAQSGGKTHEVSVGYLYFAVCLLAASVTSYRDIWFYIGFSVLAGWALWFNRSTRFPRLACLALLAVVMAGGYWTQSKMATVQAAVENKFANWVANMVRRGPEGSKSSTAIGRIGRLKFSGKIVLRVEAEGAPPELLRESAFDVYKAPNWFASRRNFASLVPDDTGMNWELAPGKPADRSARVSTYLQRGGILLPLPMGTVRADNLPVLDLRTNSFGAVRVDDGPSLLHYQALYGVGEGADSGPDPASDLVIPEMEQPALKQIADELGLDRLSKQKRLNAIKSFFSRNFTYSSYLTAENQRRRPTPLARFLLDDRSGHCEYFGTATVLLLRQAGIPARYANGYAIQEKDPDSNSYIVRERHAHAWALYYMGGKWHDLDTTPASWFEEEEKNAGAMEPVRDFLSRTWFAFSLWRWYGGTDQMQVLIFWLLGVLSLILVWRLFFKKKRSRPARSKGAADAVVWPGADSEFYLVEKRLTEMGLERRPDEPLLQWLKRVEHFSATAVGSLRELVKLHYRYRFDPRGLDGMERAVLKHHALQWLKQQSVILK